MLLPVLLYSSETMVCNKKYRSKVQCVQMDSLRDVLGVRRIDKMSNERIRELCGVKKWVNERINESTLRWFGHVERMDNSRLVKRMYSGCLLYTSDAADERSSVDLGGRRIIKKKRKKKQKATY